MSYEKYLAVAVAAALKAGGILRDGLGRDHVIRYKSSADDLVTEMDRLAEGEIVKMIGGAFPDHEIVAEEGSTGADEHDFRWYIDPLDGTTNYAHAYPLFCTSIGLEEQGELVAGVVYVPVLDELFVAAKGQGATRNGKPIHVSGVRTLLRSLLCTGFPHDQSTWERNIVFFRNFMGRCQAVRRDGVAALDMCYVAMGRYDGYWELGFAPWDMAAATVIVREAGGVVTLPDGRPIVSATNQALASNGLIHDAIIAVLTDPSGPGLPHLGEP